MTGLTIVWLAILELIVKGWQYRRHVMGAMLPLVLAQHPF